jgi:hypothetical protein
MRWLREAGWVVALCLAVYVLTAGLPKRKPQVEPEDARAVLDKSRAEREARQAKRAADLAKLRLDGTLETLRMVGKSYLRRLAQLKSPPREEDMGEVTSLWRSRRDEAPLVILWGVDLNQLPDGAGVLLAWEQFPDDEERRCVLMADGKTAKLVSAEEFDKLPRAK